MFRHFYRVWHGGGISEAAVGDWRELILWVCRQRSDGDGRAHAGLGNTSRLACHTVTDGRDLGAYLWIGRFGGERRA